MNGWRRVPRVDPIPQCCAVLPQLGAAHVEGYIDVGTQMTGWDPQTFISVHAARLLGEFVGLADPAPLEAEIARLTAENEDLKAQVREADKFAEAAEYTLSRFGAKVQKKPGRPKNQEVAA